MLFQEDGWCATGVHWKLCPPEQADRRSWGHAQHCRPDQEPGGARVCGGLSLGVPLQLERWQCSVGSERRPPQPLTSAEHFSSVSPLGQGSPTFLTSRTGLVEDSFSTDRGRGLVLG